MDKVLHWRDLAAKDNWLMFKDTQHVAINPAVKVLVLAMLIKCRTFAN